jgi:hypothetical protein
VEVQKGVSLKKKPPTFLSAVKLREETPKKGKEKAKAALRGNT